MNYVKKMCILRQIKQGFSGDGKALSGLVKTEQYGKNLAVEVSIINFAPLAFGEYYCLLADAKNRTELLPLRGKRIFNLLSDIETQDGFCAVICLINHEVIPIAYGINGNKEYDWKKLINATLPPSNAPSVQEKTNFAITQSTAYNDEEIAPKNYYEDKENEQGVLSKISENATTQTTTQNQDETKGVDLSKNDDASSVRHAFTTDGDGYFQSVQSEIDELLAKYPKDESLKDAFPSCEWVRIQGEKENPLYLVGVVYENGKAKYICYALSAKDKHSPPDEIKDVCTFVPSSAFDENVGFFVIFQSASTGECIHPKRI